MEGLTQQQWDAVKFFYNHRMLEMEGARDTHLLFCQGFSV